MRLTPIGIHDLRTEDICCDASSLDCEVVAILVYLFFASEPFSELER